MPRTDLLPVLAELRALGVKIEVTPQGPRVTRPPLPTTTGPIHPPIHTDADARFADLLPLLRLHRSALIQYFTPSECRLCGRACADEEDRERMDSPAFCDRYGARGKVGGEWVTVEPRCPYKEDAR